MSWTIIWNRAELARFGETYDRLYESDPEAAARVTRALAVIDGLLERSPDTAGESRANFQRMVIAHPLTVTYEVHSEEQIVYVVKFQYLSK